MSASDESIVVWLDDRDVAAFNRGFVGWEKHLDDLREEYRELADEKGRPVVFKRRGCAVVFDLVAPTIPVKSGAPSLPLPPWRNPWE